MLINVGRIASLFTLGIVWNAQKTITIKAGSQLRMTGHNFGSTLTAASEHFEYIIISRATRCHTSRWLIMLQYNINHCMCCTSFYNLWNNHHVCWNNDEIYRNNGLKHWEQKNRIIGNFISIIGSSLITIMFPHHTVWQCPEYDCNHVSTYGAWSRR